jgi:hypothetical protein
MWKITDFNATSVPVLNKVFDDINKEKIKYNYTGNMPTVDNVNPGEIHIMDDGSIRRLYFKTHKGSLQYLTSSTSGEANPNIWPIERGGTNTNYFVANKFIIFDGVRLVASQWGGADILTWNMLDDKYVPYIGAIKDVDLGAHSLTISTGEKIVFDGDNGGRGP